MFNLRQGKTILLRAINWTITTWLLLKNYYYKKPCTKNLRQKWILLLLVDLSSTNQNDLTEKRFYNRSYIPTGGFESLLILIWKPCTIFWLVAISFKNTCSGVSFIFDAAVGCLGDALTTSALNPKANTTRRDRMMKHFIVFTRI